MRSFAIIVFGAVLMLSAFTHQTDTARAVDGAGPKASVTHLSDIAIATR